MRNKMFAMYAHANNHHGGGRHAVWLKAATGDQPRMVKAASQTFFVPPYMGKSGWVGMWLDADTDWELAAELAAEAYRLVAPKRLIAGSNND